MRSAPLTVELLPLFFSRMKITKLPFLLITCMAAFAGSQVSLAKDPQQPQNSASTWQNSPDLPVADSGQIKSYKQIKESQVVCRYLPNLFQEIVSGKNVITLDPVVINPTTKKLILVCDNPCGFDNGITIGNVKVTGFKDFEYHYNENKALTIFSAPDPNYVSYNNCYNNEGGLKQLRWDLKHFSFLKDYIAPDIDTTVDGIGKYWFAQVTFDVDESKLNETGSLHFEGVMYSEKSLSSTENSDVGDSIDIIVPIQIEAEQSK